MGKDLNVAKFAACRLIYGESNNAQRLFGKIKGYNPNGLVSAVKKQINSVAYNANNKKPREKGIWETNKKSNEKEWIVVASVADCPCNPAAARDEMQQCSWPACMPAWLPPD